MSDARIRLIVAIIMWVVIGAFAITIGVSSSLIAEAWAVVAMTLAPLLIGFVVTLALFAPGVFPWMDADRLRAMQGQSSETDFPRDAKLKRAPGRAADDGRLAALMEIMTPDERAAFKRELKRRVLDEATIGADGEIDYGGVPLSQLLDAEPDERSRRR